jgi:PAS domain S-box-containing protein
MKDEDKSTDRLMDELVRLRKRVDELKEGDTHRMQIAEVLEKSEELNKFQALYDLALAITADRSLEENLSLVVEKSRELLGADKSFIALRDEDAGDLYMHTLSGIVTEAFQDLRIPIGVGMGGVVAETGRLYVVEDYVQEVGPIFHDVVKAEGLISGIAVPIQINGINLGVLYVFNRTRTPFAQSDLDTLSLLGNLAALEIQRKESEERIRQNQETYKKLYDRAKRREELDRSLLDSSADAIVVYDMEGLARFVSPSFTRIFGWTMDEVKGRRIPFLPDSERDRTMEIIRGLIDEGEACSSFETKRLTKDGRLIEVSISASRYRDHEGNPAGILVILRDITDRKRVQEALRKSEENYKHLYAESERRRRLYRTLLEASPEPIVVYDFEGRTTYSNPAFARTFGWSLEEIEGKRVDFVPEENWPETREMIRKVLSGQGFSAQASRRYTKKGGTLDVSISGAVLPDEEGRASGSVVHLRDTTAQKKAEARLAAELKKFQGLYDLALAMTTERSLEENLLLVVEKSRELLHADKSFIALQDRDAGDLYMHTLSGIVTEAFKDLRIPLGVGMGGVVAETGQLLVVEDYLDEIGPTFHDMVRAEGLISGIAVPVQIGAKNLGVLYVFNRKKTPFSKSDLDTLSLLGNLAALEIYRKQAAERLLESEELFKSLYEESKSREELYLSLLNSSADAIVVYDLEGRAQYVNPSFTKIFGWKMEQVEGERIPFLPESEREASMAIIGDLIQNDTKCQSFETKRFTKTGGILDISISASRFRDHEGNPAGIIAGLRDITPRKRAEAALVQSEARFRTLIEAAPLGIGVMAADGSTEYLNPKFTEIFGYTIEDIPTMDAWFHAAYPEESLRAKASAAWQEETVRLKLVQEMGAETGPRDLILRCRDGSIKVISFHAVVLVDKRLIATFIDITSEAEAQQEIVRAKNQWERTFHSASDLILILDQDRRIIQINKAMADRLKVAQDEPIGSLCYEFVNDGRSPAALCPTPGRLVDGRDYSAEVFDEGLGGVFDLRISPLHDEDGGLLGSVHVARDITAFKSMERARRRAVHHLSHELKTPLVIIRSSLKKLIEEDLAAKAKEKNFERVLRNLDRLNDIQHIVQKIVSPRVYQPRAFPVVPTVLEIIQAIRDSNLDRDVALVTQLEPLETDIIDPGILTTILDTLLKNAIENTPDQGEIVISLSLVGEGVRLDIADRGVGITTSDRQFIFKAFHNTQDTEKYATKRPFEFNAGGKGLELMRLKILAEEGFFEISFESRRCRYIPTNFDQCPGRISICKHVTDVLGCKESGGTKFSVLFPSRSA